MAEPPSVVSGRVEWLWAAVAATLTVWTLLAVGLAQIGYFRWPALLLVGLIACGIGSAFYWYRRPQMRQTSRREGLFLVFIIVAGLLLFGWPAEHFPLVGDSAIYPNTAAKLASTGGLTYHYDPLKGLTLPQKQLFYVPSDRQLPWIQIRSYQGLLYGAYYMMDTGQDTAVSSRPPAVIVWMGLFEMLSGPRGMLYVTPLFGVLSLVTVYFLGKRLFDAGAGALAALWLCVSFPQIHFSRTSYAEVPGQFFLLVAVTGLVCYLQWRRGRYLLLGLATLTAAFAARVDVMLVLPTVFFFLMLLARLRDGKGLAVSLAGLAAAIVYAVWTVNRPYVGAIVELLLGGQLRFLRQKEAVAAVGLVLGALLISGFVVALRPVRFPSRVGQYFRIGVSACILAGLGYALYLRPLMPEYTTSGGQLYPTYNEELMATAAQYLGPLVLWLAACGLVLAIWKYKPFSAQTLAVVFTASLGAVFFWKYTVASVYPVALRRLVPEVLPGLFLFAALALRRLARRPNWRWASVALAGLVAVSLVAVSGRYWFYQEGRGTWGFLSGLAQRFPPDAVVLFEPQEDESVVGWFAAPLWSFFDRQALLLNSGEPDAATLREALCFWYDEGKEVYVVAQRPLPEWWPGAFPGNQVDLIVWKSGIIGQSRMFPPYIWDFDFRFPIYRWDGSSSGAGC